MADTDETKQENAAGGKAKDEKAEKKSPIKRILPIMIIIIAAGVCAGAGFGLGKMLAPDASTQEEADSETIESDNAEVNQADTDSGDDSKDVWYYDMEPVVANLNEPSVARYISITITLQISSDLSEKDGRNIIDKKMPILTDWITVYLAGLSLDNIRGDKNLKSIQSQILNAFNEKLFPDSKPRIKHVLFRHFAVQ